MEMVSLLRRSAFEFGPKGMELTGADVAVETGLQTGCGAEAAPSTPPD